MNKQTPFETNAAPTSALAETRRGEEQEGSPMPCAQWAAQIEARFPCSFLPDERAAFERHAASCGACAAFLADYESISALLWSFPIPEPLPGVPSRLRRLWEDEGPAAPTMATSRGVLSQTSPMVLASRGQGWSEEMEGCDNEIDQKTVIPLNFYKPLRVQAARPRRRRHLLAS